MADILCPYCLNKITSNTVKYECSSCSQKLNMSRLDKLRKKLPKCTNNKCRKGTTLIKCQECESELPADIFQYNKYLRFSIVGISGSGKTNYITTMIEELKKSRIGLTVAHMNSETINRFREERNQIYHNLEPADATQVGSILPYQWRVQKKAIGSNRIDSYCMTVFDGAGEDFENLDPTVCAYISESKYIIFLVDPMALGNVRLSVGNKDLIDWSSSSELNGDYEKNDASEELASSMAAYIRQTRGISTNKVIKVPIAICFTKIDLVLNQFGIQNITQESPHAKAQGFKKDDADLIDAEIRNYLMEIGEGTFLDVIDTNFSNVKFFGVSSFGNSPIGKGKLMTVEPHRVLDPLMWILSQEGIIPVL